MTASNPNQLAVAGHASQPRRGLRRGDAAAYVGVSPSKFDKLVIDGRMPKALKIDTCAIWDVRRLDESFDSLMDSDVTIEEANPWDAAIETSPVRRVTLGLPS